MNTDDDKTDRTLIQTDEDKKRLEEKLLNQTPEDVSMLDTVVLDRAQFKDLQS